MTKRFLILILLHSIIITGGYAKNILGSLEPLDKSKAHAMETEDGTIYLQTGQLELPGAPIGYRTNEAKYLIVWIFNVNHDMYFPWIIDSIFTGKGEKIMLVDMDHDGWDEVIWSYRSGAHTGFWNIYRYKSGSLPTVRFELIDEVFTEGLIEVMPGKPWKKIKIQDYRKIQQNGKSFYNYAHVVLEYDSGEFKEVTQE